MTPQGAERVMSEVKAPSSHCRVSLAGLAEALIGISALALVVIKSDAHGLSEAIKNTRVGYLPLAVAASFAVTWLMAYRWNLILSARDRSFKTRRLFVYYLIGIFFTNFVPRRGVARIVGRQVD